MELTNIGGQDLGGLININVWDAIGNDLGEITDVKLLYPDEFGYYALTYKSNGKDQIIQTTASNIKQLIQSFIYTLEHTHYPKPYSVSL